MKCPRCGEDDWSGPGPCDCGLIGGLDPDDDFGMPDDDDFEDEPCEACGGEGFVFCDDGNGGTIGVECGEC